MSLKRVAAAAAIVAGVGISGGQLTSGVGRLTPPRGPRPPPAPNDPTGSGGPPQGIPAEKCWRYGRVGPGGARGGRVAAAVPAAVPPIRTA